MKPATGQSPSTPTGRVAAQFDGGGRQIAGRSDRTRSGRRPAQWHIHLTDEALHGLLGLASMPPTMADRHDWIDARAPVVPSVRPARPAWRRAGVIGVPASRTALPVAFAPPCPVGRARCRRDRPEGASGRVRCSWSARHHGPCPEDRRTANHGPGSMDKVTGGLSWHPDSASVSQRERRRPPTSSASGSRRQVPRSCRPPPGSGS